MVSVKTASRNQGLKFKIIPGFTYILLERSYVQSRTVMGLKQKKGPLKENTKSPEAEGILRPLD